MSDIDKQISRNQSSKSKEGKQPAGVTAISDAIGRNQKSQQSPKSGGSSGATAVDKQIAKNQSKK